MANPHTQFNDTILDDLVAYIKFCQKHKVKVSYVLYTILHDCSGILGGTSCFYPKVSGYSAIEKKTTVKKSKKSTKKR